jgi:hypothetical protein
VGNIQYIIARFVARGSSIMDGCRIDYNSVRFNERLDKKTPLAYLSGMINGDVSTLIAQLAGKFMMSIALYNNARLCVQPA